MNESVAKYHCLSWKLADNFDVNTKIIEFHGNEWVYAHWRMLDWKGEAFWGRPTLSEHSATYSFCG